MLAAGLAQKRGGHCHQTLRFMEVPTTAGAPRLPSVLLMAGCAHIKPARMALPDALTADPSRFEELPLQGLGGKASGDFKLADAGGRFERSASRLALFDASATFDRASARYSLQQDAA